ncbi:MAG TPA: OmpA family protein [Pyrinomonadaceae bacterium]|jgi:outer membrane protein OmpA-like peptidoglycan-associated protein|nr:OmpA family protein [Pyrinomonadaceae bacterium]
MRFSGSLFRVTAALAFAFAILPALARAQSDIKRETVAVSYPLGQTVSLKFRGTTRLPRLKGEAKVKRSGRRNTRVELEVENLPRAYELGGVYTTFVLWAISPEGRADNLGEIKRGGSAFVNSKIDVTTPLETFALVVTAEPHYLVRVPSRMVVLENLPPRDPGEAQVATVPVSYIGNSSDYFRDQRIPDLADRDLVRTPTSLLGARQAVNLARYAGAERDAPEELQEAQAQLEQAENAWRLNQSEPDVDVLSRRAISLGAKAEEDAEIHASARKRREEITTRDNAVRVAEESAAEASKQIQDLQEKLNREESARELAERDSASANQQLRELRAENTRLRDELQTVRTEGDAAKLNLARMEGERAAEQTRLDAERKAAQQREALSSLKSSLARFGTVKDTGQGVVLVLSDALWANPRAAELTPKAVATTVDPLAALLANNPDLRVRIEAYADARGDESTLQKLTQDRAEALAGRLVSAGVDGARIQANGMGASSPVAANTTPAGRLRNRRVEITLTPSAAADAAASAGGTQQ